MPVTCSHTHHRSHGGQEPDIFTSSQWSHRVELRVQNNKHEPLLAVSIGEMCIYSVSWKIPQAICPHVWRHTWVSAGWTSLKSPLAIQSHLLLKGKFGRITTTPNQLIYTSSTTDYSEEEPFHWLHRDLDWICNWKIFLLQPLAVQLI